MMIYHIAHKIDWDLSIADNSYKTGSLTDEGFIHCSPREKIVETANTFYKGQKNLMLLIIDDSKVKSKIIWEDLYGHGFNFPHIYGKINMNEIVKVTEFECNEDGLFYLPDRL